MIPLRFLRRAAVALSALAASFSAFASESAAPSPRPPAPPVKRVVLIGIDGLGAQYIPWEKMPTLSRLRDEGHFTVGRAAFPTSSGINWPSIFCGTIPELHGFHDNSGGPLFEPWEKTASGIPPCVFSEIRRQRPNAWTASFFSWGKIGRMHNTNAIDHAVWHKPADWNVHSTHIAADEEMTDDFIASLDRDPTLIFLYQHAVDHAGHTYGWGSPEQTNACVHADAEIARAIAAIEAHGMANDTAVVLAADHGGFEKGHGLPRLDNFEVPFIVWAPALPRGEWRIREPVINADAAPTVLSLLGLEVPETMRGRPALVRTPAAAQPRDGAATGFFHFENIGGRDRAIDPDGNAITLAGVDFVNPNVFHSTFLGYAPYARFVETNYPSLGAWAEETAERLRSWGFNMLASHCETSLFPGFPHAETLNLNNPFAKSKDPEWRIAENKDAPSTGFPNVFHPDYEKAVFAAAAKRCAPLKDDPSLVGWFIDNELCWWGRGSDPATGLFDLVAKLPPEHSARKALEEFLTQRRRDAEAPDEHLAQSPQSPQRVLDVKTLRTSRTSREASTETKIGFLRLIAERYFAVNCAAIRAADPNHAILGCRFARGTLWTHDVVWEEAGKYCDAVSLNLYPWCDIDRGVVLTDQGGLPVLDEFRRVHAICLRPMLVTEWSFPALDTGRPCLHGAGQRFRTQEERAAAVELYLSTMLSEPYIAGYDWFMWVDQPAVGLRPALPEDSNYGLVSEEGRPYELVTAAFQRGNARDDARAPRESESERQAGSSTFSERERFFAEASGRGSKGAEPSPVAVAFAREADGSWVLSNGLVRLSGRIGGAFMADEIAFGDAPPAGRFRTLLKLRDGAVWKWIDTDRVTDISYSLDEATGIGTVTFRAEAGSADTSRAAVLPRPPSEVAASPRQEAEGAPLFAMTARLSLAPGRGDVLAEIISAENMSPAPLCIEKVFMRPYAIDKHPVGAKVVPKLWKGPHKGWWTLSDGRRFATVSEDPSSCSFPFFVSGDGVQHPDAPFTEDRMFEIAPGATWGPSSPMGALLKCEQ